MLYSGVEQDVERLPCPAVDAVVCDEQAFEERLVRDATQGVVHAHVDLVRVACQGKAVVQVGAGLFVLDGAGFDAGVEEPDLSGDAVLLRLEQVDGHGSGVVGLQELVALVMQPVAFGDLALALALRGGVEPVELGVDELAQRLDDVGGDLHAAVVVFDGGFDVGHVHGLTVAGGALLVPAGADEVRVDHPTAALGVGEDQPRPARTAEDAALEVVVVGLGLLPGDAVRGEHGLHPVPDLGSDEGFVQAVVHRAFEQHVALVVRAGEQLLDRGQPGRLLGSLRRRHGRQAAVDEFFAEGDGRVVPRRVRLERPLDERAALRVDFDAAHLPAQFVAVGGVEVADRGLAGLFRIEGVENYPTGVGVS
ncbi:hypothetical protein NQ036_07780 [Brevibacterium sp. 91QC2O2]|nr:hypothetical protein [Brevibacterium sp. 91QC2O2]MCQ9368140.1 hypothetical protein [Brevibacterium sp. 91QC2O2]